MAIKDIKNIKTTPTIKRRPITDVRLPDPGLLQSPWELRYLQMAYAFGDSALSAGEAVTAPAKTVGKALGIPRLAIDNLTGSTSGTPKIPPTAMLLPPGTSELPTAAPKLIGTVDVPGSQYVVDVLIQVRKV